MEIKPRDFRSPKGRRLPYYLNGLKFGVPLEPQVDEMSLEFLEINANPQLSRFEEEYQDSQEAVRRWNEEHEKIIDWFYQKDSPCLVDPRYPLEHSDHLDELSYSSQARSQKGIMMRCVQYLRRVLGNAGYEEKFIKPWLSFSKQKQEDLVLLVLSTLARAEEASDDPGTIGPQSRSRKIVPEITLANLCSDNGAGLVDFLNLMTHSALRLEDLDEHPIPNDHFFRKFGIRKSGEALPLSLADRSFQNSYILQRHSLLFKLAEAFLDAMSGEPICIVRNKLTSFRSELTGANIPRLADISDPVKREAAVRKIINTCDEQCAGCFKTARMLGINRMLYCERCKKIGRIQPYCSSACQRKDWKFHKTESCGSQVSSYFKTPIHASSASKASPLASSRVVIKVTLEEAPQAVWVGKGRKAGSSDVRWSIDCLPPPDSDAALNAQILPALRALAFRVLEDDQTAIALFAYSHIRQVSRVRSVGGPQSSPDSFEDAQDDFREMFGLTGDDAWDDALERGKLEMEKEENRAVKEHYLRSQDWIDYYSEPVEPSLPPEQEKVLETVPEPSLDDITKELSRLLVGSNSCLNRAKIKAFFEI